MEKIKKYKKMVDRIIFFMVGNILYALALRLFYIDNNIAAGGFSGIATVINYIVPINVGTLMFIMNMPLIVFSFFLKGARFTLITVSSTFVYSLIVNELDFLPTLTTNLLLASICGGVLYAFGAVCMLKADASAGGTDLLARLLILKFRNLSLGKMFLIVDGFTIMFAVLVFKNIELGLFAIVALYVCALFTDKFITGFNYASICYVITKLQPQQMANHIMEKLNRGVTWQKATGMYELNEKNVLMVVVKPKEMYKLKDIIVEHDPNAFVVVAYANEVHGGGFQDEYGRYSKKIN